jgi:diaminopimelate epimerase
MPIPIFGSANGNRFLIFDCIHHKFSILQMLFWFICRKVDSCLVISKSNSTCALLYQIYFPKGGFCGNGARVLSHYLHVTSPYRRLLLDNQIPIDLCQIQQRYSFPIDLPTQIKRLAGCYYVETLTEPHLVCFTTRDKFAVYESKMQIFANQLQSQQSINVSTCIIQSETELAIQTWERGINRWTLSCGSGILSCLAVCLYLGQLNHSANMYSIKTMGGQLQVWSADGHYYLCGQTYIDWVPFGSGSVDAKNTHMTLDGSP